jgi:hypothetical protein
MKVGELIEILKFERADKTIVIDGNDAYGCEELGDIILNPMTNEIILVNGHCCLCDYVGCILKNNFDYHSKWYETLHHIYWVEPDTGIIRSEEK